MQTLNRRSGQSAPETRYPSNPQPHVGGEVTRNRHQMFPLKHSAVNGGPVSGAEEGYQRLKNRLISRGVPENVVEELLEHPTIINYRKGSFLFLQGAPTDLVFWVSSGVVEILHPNSDGERICTSILGPGELFGFVERKDHKGRPIQAFQARARTNVQAGLLVREQICKVLMRQDSALLLQIMKELIVVCSEVSVRSAEFLGMNYSDRLELTLTELAAKFGVQESRGTLIIPEFGHNDFAEMIGCSRPMVSRLIAEMMGAGKLAQNGRHYIIIDDSALKKGNRPKLQYVPKMNQETLAE